MTAITEEPIRPQELLQEVSASGHGAEIMFLGVVRDENEGCKVSAVTYDSFQPLAEWTLRGIVEEAARRWEASVAAVHRVGRLEVGEISLAVAVGAAHRSEAYEASRWVLEEIKARLPVWKKEHYVGGDAAWLKGRELQSVG